MGECTCKNTIHVLFNYMFAVIIPKVAYESTVVDECDLLVCQVQLVALLTGTNSPISKIRLADDACTCECGYGKRQLTVIQMSMTTKGFCNALAASVSTVG